MSGADEALAGQVAVVTGAGNGLGRAYALRLASAGAAVVVADLDGDAAKRVASQIDGEGRRGVAFQVDVSDEAGVAEMAAATMAEFGRIDVLVNNAAIFLTVGMSRVGFDQISVSEWDRMMAVNVRGTWLACRAVVPHMRNRKYGKII